MSSPSYTETPYTPDRLIAGDFPLKTWKATIADNQSVGALARGTILGWHSASGTFAIVHQTGNYQAASAKAILAEACDPSGGNVEATIYVAGEFNEDELTLGGTVTLDDVRNTLMEWNVYLREPVSA